MKKEKLTAVNCSPDTREIIREITDRTGMKSYKTLDMLVKYGSRVWRDLNQTQKIEIEFDDLDLRR